MQLSIIVPVYNAEAYIEQAVNSVLCQDYDDFELILVNDGSKDRTYEILEKLRRQDERLVVLHNENRGVSYARNLGIDIASGNYIMFMDSDDEYAKGAFAKIANELNRHRETDILCYGYRQIVYKNGQAITEENHAYPEINFLSKEEIGKNILMLVKNEMFGAVWSKVYKASVIKEKHLKMQEGLCVGEDFCFNLSIIQEVSSFRAITEPLYLYKIQNEDSIIQKYNKNKFEQMYIMHQNRCDFIEHLTSIEEIRKKAENRADYVRICMSCFMDLSRKECKMTYKQKIKYVAKVKNREHERFNKEYLKFYSTNQKVIYILFSITGARITLLMSVICFYLKFYLKFKF